MKNMYLIFGDNIKTFPESALSIGVENTEIMVLNDDAKSGANVNRIFFDADRFKTCPAISLEAPYTDEIWLSSIYFRDEDGGHFNIIITAFDNNLGVTPSVVFDSKGTSFTVDDVFQYTSSKSSIPTFIKIPVTSTAIVSTTERQLALIPIRGFNLKELEPYFENTSYSATAQLLISMKSNGTMNVSIGNRTSRYSLALGIVNISWTDESQFTDLSKTVYQLNKRIDTVVEDMDDLADNLDSVEERVDQIAGTQRSLFVTR